MTASDWTILLSGIVIPCIFTIFYTPGDPMWLLRIYGKWCANKSRYPGDLGRYAERYENAVLEPDIEKRIRQRTELCGKMGQIVRDHNISKKKLALSDREGFHAALACSIKCQPRHNDHKFILLVDNRDITGNLQHMLVDALSVLIAGPGLVEKAEYKKIRAWLANITNPEINLKFKLQKLNEILQ